ncbi:transposable element Tcb2 transposase [Trichonephila clavipes]|nr:transposable element Tcb2 transposase [Trichonephila clavipes]
MRMQIKRYGTNQSTMLRSAKPTARYKALLLTWARQHQHWTVDDWKHVAWADESPFQLNRSNGRVRVGIQPHESMDPICQLETIQAGGSSVMVCELICISRNMVPLMRLDTTLKGSRRHGGGRVRSTTPAKDRYIVLSAKKEQAHYSSAGGKSVSCCLRKADLPKKLLPDV